nr:hypothetical protein CFP56_54864 [Quercus suber]
MARPSKAYAFAIWEDGDTTASKATTNEVFSGVPRSDQGIQSHRPGNSTMKADRQEQIVSSFEDHDRRESQQSQVSTLPDSTSCEDHEPMVQHTHQGPLVLRPSFMRPETVQRLRMTSPLPFDRHDHTESSSRSSSPIQGNNARCDRESIRSHSASSSNSGLDVLKYPLVLLHITVLPLDLPWTLDVMREVLPSEVLNNLMLLRTKMTDMVMQRGVLVPHPGEGYDVLEERLLEALELKPERVSGDGHFWPQHQPRDSTTSIATSSVTSDSGIGSSIQSMSEESAADTARCDTCQRDAESGRKWKIRVYAANGLMRAAAWGAAWSEMERVDVEISPRISEQIETELDQRQQAIKEIRGAAMEIQGQGLASEAQWLGRDVYDSVWHNETPSHGEAVLERHLKEKNRMIPQSCRPFTPSRPQDTRATEEMPQIYSPAQIPLALLVKNYILLLMRKQDWRNIAIMFLVFATLLLALRPRTVILPMGNESASLDLMTPRAIIGMVSSHLEYGATATSIAADTSTLSSMDAEVVADTESERALRNSGRGLGQELDPSPKIQFDSTVGTEPNLTAERSKSSPYESALLLPQIQTECFHNVCPWRFPFSVHIGNADIDGNA